MKKSKKILLASILAAGFAFGGAAALDANVASAANSAFNGVDFTSVVMSDGASVRVASDKNYGIRFQMNMDAQTYATLEAKGTRYGIAIFPKDYGYAISESVIFAAGSKATLEESDKLSDENEDGTYDMWGSLVNILPNNVTREFVGIGYVKIGTEYKLANAYKGDIANNTRSIYYVAQRAVVENDKNAAAAKAQYIDTFDTTGKEYAYTVNHIYKNGTGEVVNSETVTEYGTLNTTTSATPRADGWYKYDAESSTGSDLLYANGKTSLTFTYQENTAENSYKVGYAKTTNGTTLLHVDPKNFDVEIGGVEKAYVDGEEVAITVVNETQIQIPATVGIREIGLYDGDKCYLMDVKVADYVITDQASLKGWGYVRNTAKYAVIANDITCDGADLNVYDPKPLWVLDGLGHKVSNAYYSAGILSNGQSAMGFVMKDVTFENVKLGQAYYSLFGDWLDGGLFENVTVSAIYTVFPSGGLLFNNTSARNGQLTFRNCKFNFNVPLAEMNKMAKLYSDSNGYYGTTMENVTITSNGKIAKVGQVPNGATKPAVLLTQYSSWKNVTITDKDDIGEAITLKVGAYNTAHCIDYNDDGSSFEVNISGTAQMLKNLDLDILGLNEMYDHSTTEANFYAQTKKIADYLGTDQYVFGKAKQFTWGGNVAIGNSVVSNYNIVDVELYPVLSPTEGPSNEMELYEDRVIVKTIIDVGVEICFITTHFGLTTVEQESMAAKLLEVLDAESRPIVLCGDFNMSPNSALLQPIYARMQSAADLTDKRNKPTIASWNPHSTIDYIFVSYDFKVKDYDVVNVIMSDHMPVWAELELIIPSPEEDPYAPDKNWKV